MHTRLHSTAAANSSPACIHTRLHSAAGAAPHHECARAVAHCALLWRQQPVERERVVGAGREVGHRRRLEGASRKGGGELLLGGWQRRRHNRRRTRARPRVSSAAADGQLLRRRGRCGSPARRFQAPHATGLRRRVGLAAAAQWRTWGKARMNPRECGADEAGCVSSWCTASGSPSSPGKGLVTAMV